MEILRSRDEQGKSVTLLGNEFLESIFFLLKEKKSLLLVFHFNWKGKK